MVQSTDNCSRNAISIGVGIRLKINHFCICFGINSSATHGYVQQVLSDKSFAIQVQLGGIPYTAHGAQIPPPLILFLFLCLF